MKNIKGLLGLLFVLLLSACSSEQSLQEYYVASTENPNFISFDLPPSLLNLNTANLSETEKEAVGSLKKFNVLAMLKKEGNIEEVKAEQIKIKSILKNSNYSELMKMNTAMGKATIQVKGDDDDIDEVIIFGNNDDKGLVLIRVLGDDMNPAHLAQLIQAMEKSDFNGEGLEQLGNLLGGN